MPDEDLEIAVIDALKFMQTKDEPRDIIKLSNTLGDTNRATSVAFAEMLQVAHSGDPVRSLLQMLVSRLDDVAETVAWTQGTSRLTYERRALVCRLLGIGGPTESILEGFIPVLDGKGTVTIDEPFSRWYTRERATENDLYWSSYRDYLLKSRHWPEENVRALDLETDKVLERLADPLSNTATRRNGLVMGYVQSGKTANYTGVIAKSIDVGYRLIIVLAGMQEPLRKQTQRRLDMELLGKQNILGDFDVVDAIGSPEGEYLDDPSWELGFSELQGNPAVPEIRRLTSKSHDFLKGKHGELRYRKNSLDPPLYQKNQLMHVPARIAIIKKNKAPLSKLLAALKVNQRSMREVPALIIDDESDQASVNTNSKDKERVQINKLIVQLLRELPRGQYVGYTATPFANVFIDPSDEEDLFPRDFVISLAPSRDYMGPSRFFDPDDLPLETNQMPNRARYIRDLKAGPRDEDLQRSELENAMAFFVISGAIKLCRQKYRPDLAPNFKHHTMLVHEASQKAKHGERAEVVRQIWASADWEGNGGRELLRAAFVDLLTTMTQSNDVVTPPVDDFEEVLTFVPEVIRRIETLMPREPRDPTNCVLVINGDSDFSKRLNFDERSEWKIVVGGALLSRGFTIEGLTISYFRRATRNQDTLQQMGRWFGYRPGYEDLVRIFLATDAALGSSRTVSLYDAFVSNARNEEQFREQLSMYSGWSDDKPLLTPADIRPLVWQSLPWLKPTSSQKMKNARIVRQRTPVFSPKWAGYIPNAIRHNWALVQFLIRVASKEVEVSATPEDRRSYKAYVGILEVSDLASNLRSTSWINEDDLAVRVEPRIGDYLQSAEEGKLSDFLLIFPQGSFRRDQSWSVEIPNVGVRTTVKRIRGSDKCFGEFTDRVHRESAQQFCEETSIDPIGLATFRQPGRGVVLAYIIDDDLSEIDTTVKYTVGLTIFLPSSASSLKDSGALVFKAGSSVPVSEPVDTI